MRRIARALVFALGSLRGSALVAEDSFDGAQMVKSCGEYLAALDGSGTEMKPGSYESGKCAGFVQGAVAAHALDIAVARARTGHASTKVCIPESARLADEVRAFQKYLKANPSKLDWPGIDLLYAALVDAWPCPEKPPH
jgi:hypothetical protein